MAWIKDLNLLRKRFVSITKGGIPKHLRLKDWIGVVSWRKGCLRRQRQDDSPG